VPANANRGYSLDRRILLAIVPTLAALLIRMLSATLQFEEICDEGAAPAGPDARDVFCFWHQGLLASACHFKGRPRTTILISQSFDGELIARTIQRLGLLTARGSSSRGGAGGLRELARAIEGGSCAVFPADGPRGPRYVLKPGAIKLAQMTRQRISSFHVLPERVWKLRSWDEFLIPRPFSRVVVVWGRPVFVGRDLDSAAFESAREEAQAGLERARHLAETHFSPGAG
jgi:lysophospholipid acyltransferase (LPLAT)-like uncharacterized protein